MASRKSDPSVTGRVRLPWSADGTCPCGSTKIARICCMMPDGHLHRRVRNFAPPGPITNFAHPKCYLRTSRNCGSQISGEHLLSGTVLRLLDESQIRLRGAPWLPDGEIADSRPQDFKANILCKRHNEALSPLDDAAREFFAAVRDMYDDIAVERTLSRKRKWFLFSGEELELWMIKTACGFYEAGFIAQDGVKLRERGLLNPAAFNPLIGREVIPSCGLHVIASSASQIGLRNSIDVNTILSSDGQHMTGLTLSFMGLTFFIALDPMASYRAIESAYTYRPGFIQFRNAKRLHSGVLTWPGGTARSRKAVLFSKIPLPPSP
jgi:hypothetical protein